MAQRVSDTSATFVTIPVTVHTHTGLSNTSAYRPISHTPLSAPVSPLTLLQTSLVWDTISSEIVLNRLSHGMVTNASAYKPIGGYQPMGQES